MMKFPLLSRLWAKEPRRSLNLLAPDVVVEAHIHCLANGESRMYVSKLPPGLSPDELTWVVKCLIDQAIAFGAQHGVQVQVRQEMKPS